MICFLSYDLNLIRAFLITDALSRKDNITTSGATAVSALLKNTPNGRILYVANVGDSRAVLCSSLDENKSFINLLLFFY